MKAQIVTGLLYGDEGKGRTVDYLCSFKEPKQTIVIRYSGGQQAGHNVVVDGVQHIHSNFGSGTLRGVDTYFSEHTTIYLPNMLREYQKLKGMGLSPKVYIHPKAKITTPFDIIANKRCKANLEHGTCGKGVGKTMKRHTETPYKFYAIDLTLQEALLNRLTSIAEYYDFEEESLVADKKMDWLAYEIGMFRKALEELNFEIADYSVLNKFPNLVFEGSQGVLLDMDHGTFPFVTFANTTPKNAIEICNHLNIKDIQIFGVTRTYLTRHGNGPFETYPIRLNENFELDELNATNDFQGVFKTGKMDYELLQYAIDIVKLYSKKWPFTLVTTCHDHLSKDEEFQYEKLKEISKGIQVIESASNTGSMIIRR